MRPKLPPSETDGVHSPPGRVRDVADVRSEYTSARTIVVGPASANNGNGCGSDSLGWGVWVGVGIGMLVECFVVVVVGGMGSLQGAILSGIIMGEAIALTTLFYPQMADIVIFLVMAVVLLIRPSGLFGRAGLME